MKMPLDSIKDDKAKGSQKSSQKGSQKDSGKEKKEEEDLDETDDKGTPKKAQVNEEEDVPKGKKGVGINPSCYSLPR